MHGIVIVPFNECVTLLLWLLNRLMCDTTQQVFFNLLLYLTLSCSSLDLTLEIFNKCRLRQKILPLASQREFVLLYNGVLPPDSSLARRKSNTDSEWNQKMAKKTPKTEPRRYKSETEGKNVLFSSPDSSENVSESGDERGHLKAGHHRSTFTVTSPLHEKPSSVQRRSHLHSSNNSTQSVRRKNPRPRVELKLSKCILHYHVKAADDLKHSKTQQMRVMMSQSSSAVSEGTSACGSPETMTLTPHARRPVCVDKHEREEKTSEEELIEDTKRQKRKQKGKCHACMQRDGI